MSDETGAQDRPRAEGRIVWIDVARGIAILLVVLFHAGMFAVPTGLAPAWWTDLNLAFALLRMPLFFLLAGALAVGALRRPWRLLWETRLAVLVWVFVLWTVLRFLYYRVMPEPIELNQSSWVDLVLSVVRPSNGLWFLFALVVFLVVTKLAAGPRARVVVLVGATLCSLLLHSEFTTGNVAYDGILRYYVFFLVGVLFRDRLLRLVAGLTPLATAGLLAGFVAGLVLRAVTGVAVDVATALPVAAAGALGTLGVAKLLSPDRGGVAGVLGRPFAYLGSRTLQVYVTHVLVLSALTTVLLALTATPAAGAIALLGPAMPILLAALAVAASLVIARAAESLPVTRLLYAAPDWFARRRVSA